MTVGAIIGGSERVAVIQEGGQIYVVGVGDHVGDAAVVEIRDDKVVLRKGDVTFEVPYGAGRP
jgi:Tfp pilus assembly protein PilP